MKIRDRLKVAFSGVSDWFSMVWVRNPIPVGFAAACAVMLLLTLVTCSVRAQTVTLTATPTTGISPLSVTLNWSATGFDSSAACTASGSWTGSRPLSGSATIVLNGGSFTYSLSCSSSSGVANLTWTPPTQNTDGSAIAATGTGSLAGYEIFHAATSSGVAAATPVPVNDKTATTYTLTGLPVGPRFYRIKAFNASGVRSDLSAEVSNTIVAPSASASANVVVNVKPKPPVMVVQVADVYDLREPASGDVKLGRRVGRVSIGTQCSNDVVVQSRRGIFYEVPQDAVLFTKTPKSSIVVARCVEA